MTIACSAALFRWYFDLSAGSKLGSRTSLATLASEVAQDFWYGSENEYMVERLLATSDQQGAGVGHVTLANQLVETLSDDGIRELRLSWCAVSEDALDVTTE